MDTTDKDSLGQEPLVYPSLLGKNLLSHSTAGVGWAGQDISKALLCLP